MNYYDIGIGREDEVVDGKKYMSLETSLRTHELRKGSRKILKLDVEGAEYTTLPAAMDVIAEFDQILMEVHWMDPRNETQLGAVKGLQKYFYLYHIHFNNHSPDDEPGKFVFETAWIRKDLAK